MGTARFATLGLARARLEVAFGDGRRVAHAMDLPPDTWLLYPGEDAPALEHLPAGVRPRNLLILDGTWAQSRALMRQNPWVGALPRVCITPGRPSRYRVRKEPRREYVSTLEAIEYALAVLEPEVSLAPLIDAFERMMDDHLAQRSRGGEPRVRRPRRGRSRAVPHVVVDQPERVAVVYLEPSLQSAHPGPRLPIQLCAQRLSDGARFERFALAHGVRPAARHLEHMALDAGDFRHACSVDQAVAELSAFLAGCVSVGWNDTPESLLAAAGGKLRCHVGLKAAYCNQRKAHAGSLEHVLASEGLAPGPAAFRGRAGQRMANARALLDLLRARATRATDVTKSY